MTDKLTMKDCRDVGFCVDGVRRACVVHAQDFRGMVRNGIPLAEMEKLEDINVRRACIKARERIKNG